MEIKRRGASKDHGWNIPELEKSTWSWDTDTKRLKLSLKNVNFGGNAAHDYVVTLSPKDIADLIITLGDDAASDANRIEKPMRRALRGLARLTAMASGLPVANQSENNDT